MASRRPDRSGGTGLPAEDRVPTIRHITRHGRSRSSSNVSGVVSRRIRARSNSAGDASPRSERLAECGKGRKSASDSLLCVGEIPVGDTPEELEVRRAGNDLRIIAASSDMSSVGTRVAWRVAKDAASKRLENAQKILDLTDANLDLQSQLAEVTASRDKAKAQLLKSHKTLAKVCERQSVTCEELHNVKFELLEARHGPAGRDP